ncbi:MAG: hypothetical protein LC687_05515 [Actinobacteria bacterium]|nr:hypothetical protein [Actinomycetota bacterium]MCA1807289.1 hypothetical protein [Actinomycetota bacterium]
MYKLHVNLPNRPPGSRVYVPGLGTYDNGSTNEISDTFAESAFQRYPRLFGAVDGTDIVVGEKPAQVEEAVPVAMHALDFPVEETE